MGRDISSSLREWMKSGQCGTRELAKQTGIHEVSISQYRHGKRIGDKTMARLAAAFDVTIERFLEGPEPKRTVEKPAVLGQQEPKRPIEKNVVTAVKGQDELYECKASRLKALICEGCQVPRRRCAIQCKLERYFRLCYEVVNGMTDMRNAEIRAKNLAEDCIKDSNALSDIETGYEA